MPSAVLLARFQRFYGAALYRAPHYRTADHVVPFGLFWIYYRAMESTQALERVQHTKAVSMAIGLAFGKDGKLPESVTADLQAAFLDG